jgi:uncharacterized membrane protein
MDYTIVKWLHILSSTLLFGTGLGTAFFMFCANRSRNIQAISVVTHYVAIADWSFTAPTVILQPLSGFYLANKAGYALTSGWILWSFALYLLAGACWLPVVWLQLRLRDMAATAARDNTALPDRYWHYERIWTLLGIPAFFSLIVVFYLMVAKP